MKQVFVADVVRALLLPTQPTSEARCGWFQYVPITSQHADLTSFVAQSEGVSRLFLGGSAGGENA